MKIQVMVFWVMAQCRDVNGAGKGTYIQAGFTLNVEAVLPSEMLVS
jgi:hypothetical protein